MNRTHIGLGIFIVGTLGLLVWLAQAIGAIGGGGGDLYQVRLSHAAGLVENNAVKIAGVNVGRIERIAVEHDEAVLSLRVRDEVVLHEGARAIVRAKSLLGEKYLQLEPGVEQAPELEPGSEITDVTVPFEMDQMLNSLEPLLSEGESLAGSVAPLAETLNRLLVDATGGAGGEPLMTREELEAMLADIRATTAAVRRVTEQNEDKIGRIVANADRLLANPKLGQTIDKVDHMVTTIDQRLPKMLDRTENAIESLEKLASVVDERRAAKLGKVIDDAEVISTNLRKLSAELDGVGQSVKPLLVNLAELAKRAVALDEAYLRQFLQREGVKVYFGTKREAERTLDELE